jgi:hypothetical protein
MLGRKYVIYKAKLKTMKANARLSMLSRKYVAYKIKTRRLVVW